VVGSEVRAASAPIASPRPRSDRSAGRMPRRQVAQLAHRQLRLAARLLDELAGALGVAVEALLGHAEVQGQRDQARLGAVVQVALDALQLGGRGVDGAGARLGQDLDALLELAAAGAEHDARERAAGGRRAAHERRGDRAAGRMPMPMARKAWPHESTWKRPSSVGSDFGSAHHQAGIEISPSVADHAVTDDGEVGDADRQQQQVPGEVLPRRGVREERLQALEEPAVGRPVDARDRLAQHQRGAPALEPRHPARDVDGDHRDGEPDERDGQAEGQRPAGDHHGEGEDPHRQRQQQIDRVESQLAKQGTGALQREHGHIVGGGRRLRHGGSGRHRDGGSPYYGHLA
jgi:hypothetical protein